MSERIWGPDFDEYSAQNFKPQGSDVPMSKIEFFDINGQFREVPPLALIETSLSRCDPRIYGTVSLNLNIVSTALVEYSLANDVRNIFQHYYGFLCVRYLLHITCLAALGPTRHAVNKILNTLPQDASWEELCKIISIEALDKASQAMRNPTSFNEFCRVFDDNRFSGSFEDDSPKELYIALTATLLWGDRDLFFTLCQRDLLPGSTLLLVVALELALSGSVKETSYETLVRLKELAFRAYLAGSYQERQILPIACMPIIEKEKPEDYEPDYFVNSEDGQKISRAYFNLLPRWRQDKSEAENIPVGFMTDLTGFAFDMLILDSSATIQSQIDAIEISLQLLWLLFEHRGQIPTVDHPHFRTYGMLAIITIISAHDKCNLAAQGQSRLSRVCANVEFVALAGRILLLIPSQGSAYRNMINFQSLLSLLPSLGPSVMKDLVAAAPELFHDSKIERAKVLRQCLEYQEAETTNLDKKKLVLDDTNKIISSWLRFTKSLEDERREARSCAYPRCSGLSLPDLTTRYTCGRCNSATYCDSSCQRAHWELTTSESHKLACGQPDRQVGDLETT